MKKQTDKQTKLTEKQARVLEFIKDHLSVKGYPPTIREICKGFGYSSPLSAKQHVDTLIRKGYLRKDDAKQRAIEVTGMRKLNTVRLPVVGRVRAGEPVLAVEDIEDYITLDKGYLNIESGFALRVTGHSMIEAGIGDGDIVFVDAARAVGDGDIAIVLVGDDEATIKRFYRKGAHVMLVPENKDMQPMLLNASDVSVLGRVMGVMRRFSD
ncbi:transcriptional repressor LexA [Candidatus Magnetominusculus xianensis]|uniref:LexA repressor n=1 Tax=Candidatus Magnetominusculus xianensis TaxID=1748249 RepID=A0ABR5SFY2_9BACT|nr:transcriptional repressor LexA [Candidatus Magnetominusculus xianensis]KWT78168.1 LexA repressor [Candidatus Magnetominusculus xianensis]MBF0404695.1 repressor LexA [Nitrospirota bacterium]